MGTITVRMNEKEQKLFEEYAKMHDMPLSMIIKQTLKERIEDELDMETIRAYESDIQDDDVTVYGHGDMKRMLDL